MPYMGKGVWMFSEDVVRWVELVVTALAGSLSAMGYYDFIKKRILRM